ncbi:unnamed protein product, partial [marine sediment metagenome]
MNYATQLSRGRAKKITIENAKPQDIVWLIAETMRIKQVWERLVASSRTCEMWTPRGQEPTITWN